MFFPAFIIAEDAHAIWIIAVGNLFAIITLILKNVFDERKAIRDRKADREDREAKLIEQEFLHRQQMEKIARESEKLAQEIAAKGRIDGERRIEGLRKHQSEYQGKILEKLQENTDVTKEVQEKLKDITEKNTAA